MKIGDYVRVLKSTYKTVNLIGAVGKIVDHHCPSDSYAVELDGYRNGKSSKGCYYFKSSHLELYKGDEQIMEGNYRIALVQFIEGTNTDKTYKYACYDSSIDTDDICVVKSAHHGLGIAKVVGIGPKTDEPITREIVCKADFSAYERREQNRKRAAELKQKMAERAEKLQEIALYAMLAKEDPAMSELLKEFEDLTDGIVV